MKKIKYILIVSLLAVLTTFSSCSDFLDVNTDPNRVTDSNITPLLIFTQAEQAIGVRQATRFVFLNNWMGYWGRSGSFVVEQEETSYKVTNTFGNNNWANAYNILFDLYQVKNKALVENDTVLAGAAMVLSAKLWQETVDQFGAIPYSQAFDYVKYPRPAYDAATAIYADLETQLNLAVTYLNKTPKKTFATGDIIYCRGVEANIPASIVKWKKLANTIKLRMWLRQSEKGIDPTAKITAIVAADGFIGANDGASVNPGYSNQVDKQNPFYASYGLTPTGSAASTNNKANNYIKSALGASDPRLNRYFKAPVTGTDYGARNGNKTGSDIIVGSDIGPGLAGSATQDQFILPAFESLFFQAEAIARGWMAGGDAAAKTTFESAVTQSFIFLGLTAADATTYIANVATAQWTNSGTTVADKAKFITYQKYLSLCGIDALEAWNDHRRLNMIPNTGYLSNNPVRESKLPYLLPYPQSEITSNGVSVPTRASIFTEKLFWQP
jgi:hypothetical protein